MTDAIQNRLRKLALLASQGIGGEKENAEVIFQRLCKKHGFEPVDFINTDARIIDTIISVKASDEKALLHNILAMVTDDHKASICWTRGRATRLTIRTTAAQAAEVRFLFSIYRHAWKKEKERLYTAFLHKHDLFPATPSSTSSSRPLSREESARLRAMMDGMDSVTPRKAISNNGRAA